MYDVVPYLLPTPAGWFITFVAVVTIIGLLIGILKVLVKICSHLTLTFDQNNKILQHLETPKLFWKEVEPCKYCRSINELDLQEQYSEVFICSKCKMENKK